MRNLVALSTALASNVTVEIGYLYQHGSAPPATTATTTQHPFPWRPSSSAPPCPGPTPPRACAKVSTLLRRVQVDRLNAARGIGNAPGRKAKPHEKSRHTGLGPGRRYSLTV